MASLLTSLRNLEPFVLPVIAQAWNIDLDGMDHDDLISALVRAMKDPRRLNKVLDSLSDPQVSALRMVANSNEKGKGLGTMPEVNFNLFYGDVRSRGQQEIEIENPLSRPGSVAEALYYRGLIGIGFENSPQGARKIVFVPEELIPLVQAGGYKEVTLDDEFEEIDDEEPDDDSVYQPVRRAPTPPPRQPEPEAPPKPVKPPRKAAASAADPYPLVEAIAPLLDNAAAEDHISRADTSLIDDLVTVLAYTRIQQESVNDGILDELEAENASHFFLAPGHDRLRFLIGIGVSLGMMDAHNRHLRVLPADILPRWLQATRSEQVRLLAEAWKASERFVDLLHVPGIAPEPDPVIYYPRGARQEVLKVLAERTPQREWWSIDDFVALCWHFHRHFQRPNGDYDLWYIRDAKGQYLKGEASWPQVDGGLLRYYLKGPLHWLGMLDLAQDSQGREIARWNAYGQAFIHNSQFPKPPESPEKIAVMPDGQIQITRKASRYDRYQVARFTTWISAGQTYVYQLDGDGLRRAQLQKLTVDTIGNLLVKLSGAALPDRVSAMLTSWMHGERATASIETLQVLRVTSEDLLDAWFNDPNLRRFMGARLGPTDIIVRDVKGLRQALGEIGINVEEIPR